MVVNISPEYILTFEMNLYNSHVVQKEPKDFLYTPRLLTFRSGLRTARMNSFKVGW